MENASKALLMAGSIFLSLLVIALLITMYQNLIQVEQVEYQGELTEQIAEYNKQYEVYQRDNLYGSDILSLANKIMDYNAREIDEKGYQEMKISVKFKDRIVIIQNLKMMKDIFIKENQWHIILDCV